MTAPTALTTLTVHEPTAIRARLRALAMDLAWSWRELRRRPFQMLDMRAWEATRHSPLGTLASADDDRLATLSTSTAFMGSLDAAEADAHAMPAPQPFIAGHSVAYYCSEYALHESLAQYAGGLGVLAGDHLKQASDLGMPLCAVGLLYGHGYYRQELDEVGRTRVSLPRIDRSTLPIEPTGVVIACPIGRRQVHAQVWRIRVGRVNLYVLDADLARNRPEDRELTLGLYRGEPLLRLRQQVLLGVGGVMALHAVGERPTVHHLNEGHAAFAAIELLRRERERDPGAEAEALLARVRQSIVFTTHTPVPAGHDRYPHADVLRELGSTSRAAGLTASALKKLGREHPANAGEPFCMTVLALRTCRACNGVAKIHGEVSRQMWKGIEWGTQPPVAIASITNGVHLPTWCDPVASAFWRDQCQVDANGNTIAGQGWERAEQVDRAALWSLRTVLRSRLVHFVRERCARSALARGEGAAGALRASQLLREDALTIGFARRFATYKRAPLIFHDVDRLAAILGNANCPVQLIFAGKAHPRDAGGQAYAQRVFEMTQDPRLVGRVAILEDYDMEIGRVLTSGADLWLNNPLRPMEASGTSGMKPPLAGGMNLSILDGWWPEGFDGRNGWAPAPVADGGEQASDEIDSHDASELYRVLETDIVPLFWDRADGGLPAAWLDRAAHSAASVPPRFGTVRMLDEYAKVYGLLPS
ncbi:MAG: alpha-glucan family phosphorylase [Planctomycetota bacterium]|nr:alpha-glucan family phosphorylase [Planctomycetota bacterium]MDA1105637.1 alpha-glucan family phosphorylase [Planctomycetota bacterium]